jgi:hypothetical protein
LIKYFGFVGSALVVLLFGMSWCFPQPINEPIGSGIDRPVIRISSVEKLPDRVDIDTNLPTIVPPPGVMEFAERQPLVKQAETHADPKPKSQPAEQDSLKKQKQAKREPPKRVASDRPRQVMKNGAGSNYREQAGAQFTRLSLLEVLKERFGHGLFRAN